MYYDFLLLGHLVWNLPLLVLLIGISFLYSYLIKRYTDVRLFNKQPIFFFLSLCLICLILGSPLSAFSHLSLSLHMIQMSILYFIIPPLLLVGIPPQLFARAIRTSLLQKIGKLFLTPKLALMLFSALFLLYHLPFLLEYLSQAPLIQSIYLCILFILSFSLWWPIVSPDHRQRLYKKQKKNFILLTMLMLMPACSLFILSAFIDGVQNPYLNQLAVLLCLPTNSNSLDLLASPFHSKYDPLVAGTLMLGIHKSGIMLSTRLAKK